MEFDKEKFNKLKQLDRIEYRQKQDIIFYNNKIKVPIFSITFSLFLFISGMAFILYEAITGVENLDILNIIIFSTVLFIIIFPLEIIGNFSRYSNIKKQMKELDEEYFKIEVKK